MSARTGGELLWMRATICGITASHVSMDTCPKPSMSAASTSGAAPWLNHRVSRRRISCRGPPLRFWGAEPPSAILRKKPEMAGATCRVAAAGEIFV